jgi:hypothetical protein
MFHLPLPVKGKKNRPMLRVSAQGISSSFYTFHDTGPWFFLVSSGGLSHLVASYNMHSDAEDPFYPDVHRFLKCVPEHVIIE